ncbi:MAG: nucleotide sugar dehydrogenase [Vulcanimicrobiota bacterium]
MYKPKRLAVIGLGYVGLPLAVAFARHLQVLGFDTQQRRIEELRSGEDRNGEISAEELGQDSIAFSCDPRDLGDCDFIVVAVPTPIDEAKQPDCSYLVRASQMVGKHMPKGAIVVYESTVYPGCTQEVCLPELEQASGWKCPEDFSIGYSPERLNPGDPEHSLDKVIKIVSGYDDATLEKVCDVYGLVAHAGMHKASNLATAEAAKVIENIQRDLNIAMTNEWAMLFHKLRLDPIEVLEAAGTKWNFLHFRPGLVGGHCIPVDPFYLAYKARQVGFHTDVLLAGRRVNDGMGEFVAQQAIKLLIQAGKVISGCRVLVLGLAFKPNVRDTRNSRVFDMIRELESYGVQVSVFDPLVERDGHGFDLLSDAFAGEDRFDCLILAVPHRAFLKRPSDDFCRLLRTNGSSDVVVDVPGVLDREVVSQTGAVYWRL